MISKNSCLLARLRSLPTSMLSNFCEGSELRENALALSCPFACGFRVTFHDYPNGELSQGRKEQYLLKIINHKTIRPKGILGDAFSVSVKALFTLQLYTMW